MLRRVLGNPLWLVQISAVVVVVALIVAATLTGRSDRALVDASRAEEPPANLGIDPAKGTCPKAEPEKLPPDALAGATEAALDQVPSVFGHVIAYVGGEARTSDGAYAGSAYLTEGGSASRPVIVRDMCRERPQYGQRLLDRSVEVNMLFPEVEKESASLSQHTVFVAKFEGDYRVWGVYR